MDLFTILGTCLRRWYVVLPVLAISGYFAMQAYQQVESEYTASTSIVILPSQPLPGADPKVDTPTLDNPYAGSGGPKLAAAVLSKNINSSAFRDRLSLAPGDTSTFASTVSPQQPIITVDATASSPEAATSTLDAVTVSSRVVLDEFQAVAEAPEAKRYLVAAAVPAGAAVDVTPSRWRSAGAILVVGAALAALLAVGFDAALRSRRRDEKLEDTGPDEVDPDPSPPAKNAPLDEPDPAEKAQAAVPPEPQPGLDPVPAAQGEAEAAALLHGRARSGTGGSSRPLSVPRARTSLHQDK